MDSSTKFTLIVPTLNRTKELSSLLKSLKGQVYKDFEVIVVDQNSDERLGSIIDSYKSDLIISRIKHPPLGASSARNAGIALAKGQIFTFPDDDCEYPSDLLLKVNQIFEDSKSLAGITISSFDPTNNGSIAHLSKKEGVINMYNILNTVIEAGIFIKRTALDGVLFDTELGVGALTPWWSDEGPDLLLRVMINKKNVFIYKPSLFIFHPDPVKNYDEKARIRAYRYGCGRGRFLKKHGYPLWFVFFIWGKYLAGIIISIVQINFQKIKYYSAGLRGRVSGYFSK